MESVNELSPIKHPCVYSGPADYMPIVCGNTVTWRKDTTGTAPFAVHVPNIANVRKFARLVRIECFELGEER